MACLWYTDTSQASSCARCQAYKKSCREGAPGKGVLLPKKRRVVVVDDDNDDDDDDDAAPPKPGPSPKGKGKERARERRREDAEASGSGRRGSADEAEFPVPPDPPRLRPKGEWAKLEEELRTFSVRDLLVRSVVETAQLRVALTPLVRQVRSLVDAQARIDAWDAYAARGRAEWYPQQNDPDSEWVEGQSGSESGSEEAAEGGTEKEPEQGQEQEQEEGEASGAGGEGGSDPAGGPTGGD